MFLLDIMNLGCDSGATGSPIVLQSTSSDSRCLAGILFNSGGHCYSNEGQLVGANLEYYQGQYFDGSLKGCEYNLRNFEYELVGNKLKIVEIEGDFDSVEDV